MTANERHHADGRVELARTERMRPIYDYAWFAGFGVAFLLHAGLMQTSLRPVLRPSFPED